MKLGVVGLPNVGKSTLFNAITCAGAQAANYPFCTIEPNTGVVAVPDHRLDVLSEMYHPEKYTPATLEFVDIAGLVKGASRGEGLGNKFLSHIREVDAIVHVVRCFEDDNVIHVDGSVDPARDIDVINTELILADIETVTRRAEKAAAMLKKGEKKFALEAEAGQVLLQHLGGRAVLGSQLAVAVAHQVACLLLPLGHGLQVRQDELGLDGLDVPGRVDGAVHVDDVAVLEAAHHVHDGVHLADVGEEFVAQPLAAARALHQARDVHELQRGGRVLFGVVHFRQHVQPPVRHGHHAGVRLNGAEGIIRRLRAGTGDGVEQRALAHVRQAHDA